MEAILKVGAVKTEEAEEARLDNVCQTNPIFSFYPIVLENICHTVVLFNFSISLFMFPSGWRPTKRASEANWMLRRGKGKLRWRTS